MGLRERIEQHPVLVFLLVIALSTSATLLVVYEAMVVPRNQRIRMLKAELEDADRAHAAGSAGSALEAADGPAAPRPQIHEEGGFSPLSMHQFFDQWLDQSQPESARDDFAEGMIGQRVVWDGVVESVQPKPDGRILLALQLEDADYATAFFYFSPASRTRVLKLQEGRRVRVTGRIESVATDPFLEDSQLLQEFDSSQADGAG